MNVYNINDLCKGITKNKKDRKNSYLGNRTLAKRIVSLYFKKVKEQVLEGYDYDFKVSYDKPLCGSICINKRRLGKQNPRASTKASLLNSKRILSYNPKTIGFYYEIKYTWDKMEEHDMEFKACPSFRKTLFESLYYGNKDYLLKEENE